MIYLTKSKAAKIREIVKKHGGIMSVGSTVYYLNKNGQIERIKYTKSGIEIYASTEEVNEALKD